MILNSQVSLNWFKSEGDQYAKYRPQYPELLGDSLASLTVNHQKALDVGCGTGQLTTILARYFNEVIGIDPSESQINHAVPHKKIHYQVSAAEKLPDELFNLDLITVAQAAHWLDLSKFYQEVKKVLAPDGILALISYGVIKPEIEIRDRVYQFYYDEIGQFWPAERKLVDEGYRTIDFPFQEILLDPMQIILEWDLAELIGYISTWSAVKRIKKSGDSRLLVTFYEDISDLWGDPLHKRRVEWPINMRIGKLV